MRAAGLFLPVVIGCGGSVNGSTPIDAGTDVTLPDAGPPPLCNMICGTVDAGIDGSMTTRCSPGQICGEIGTLAGFECCTPTNPPGNECYPGNPAGEPSCPH